MLVIQRPFKNRTLLNQPGTFRNELCMLIAVCSSGYFFFLHSELVRELVLDVQAHHKQNAVSTIAILGKAAPQIQSFPVFFRNFIKEPTTTRGWSVEDRLKAI